IFPTVSSPPSIPSTNHMTDLSVRPVVVTVNLFVVLICKEIFAGAIVIIMPGFGGGGGVVSLSPDSDPPPQPVEKAKAIKIATATKPDRVLAVLFIVPTPSRPVEFVLTAARAANLGFFWDFEETKKHSQNGTDTHRSISRQVND